MYLAFEKKGLWVRAIFSIFLLGFCGVSSASTFIVDRIEIIGNEKTLPGIILQELTFAENSLVSQQDLDRSVQAVKDLSLFKTVTLDKTEIDGEKIITITIEEKRYNFILPKLNRNGDGDITTGVVWRSENLFGRNQQSKLTLAYRTFEDTDEDNATQLRWEYYYPRIAHSNYSLGVNLENEDILLEETIDGETGEYERDFQRARFVIGKLLKQDGPSHGLTLNGGVLWEDYTHEFIAGTPDLLPDVTVVGAVVGLNGYYVHDHLLSRSGEHYGYELVLADDALGSDIKFASHFFFYRKYIPLQKIEHSNLNLQFRAGYISRSVLGPPHFKVGGSRNLRGYDRDAVEGNAFIIFNAEWLRPLFNKETLRGGVIADLGNAWDSSRDISLSDLRYSAGVGLRWKLKRFVRTDVRLDIARGFSDDGETKVSLSTRATF